MSTDSTYPVVAVVLFVLLLMSCAQADSRERELLGRLCTRGDYSACEELQDIELANQDAGR